MKFPEWRQRREEDLEAEIQAHLEEAVRERMERGETPEQAECGARREFGNVDLVKGVTRDMWGGGPTGTDLSGCALRTASVAAQPGICLCRSAHTGTGAGNQHGHLQRGE